MRQKYVIVLAAAAPLISFAACGGDDNTNDAMPDVLGDRAAKDAGAESDVATDAGACGRAGYILDDAYDTRCGFCYASAPQYLPPPIQWEPCSSNAFPTGLTCQQMKRTWGPSTSPNNGTLGKYFEGASKGYVDATGHAVLAFGIATDLLFQEIVAYADGLTLTTLLELNADTTCMTVTHDARDGYYALRVFDGENNNWVPSANISPFGGGAIGGEVSNLRPRVYAHYHKGDTFSRHYYASPQGLLEQTTLSGNFTLYDWLAGIGQPFDLGSQSGLDINYPVMSSGVVFFEAANSTSTLKEQIWTPDGGVSDFISYGSDTSQAAGNIGTDGHDLVWTYGSGRDGGTGPYPVESIMTSPFTSTSSGVQPRRLRSEGPCIGSDSDQYVVGCGYAAHPTCAFEPSAGTVVVRLSDGRSWPLVSQNTPFAYGYPIAITCDELFIVIIDNNIGNIARIRLDSLGPGLPPD